MKKEKRILIWSLISLSVFILFLILVMLKKTFVDGFINNLIMNAWNPTANGFFIFLGNYAGEMLIAIALFFGLFLYLRKKKMQSLILISTLIIGYILEKIIKAFVQSDRPLTQLVQETSYSFPSGHAVFSIILFSMLIYFYKDEIKNNTRKIIFIFSGVFLILLVGFSRIYLNVHWFTDVIGGYALGFFLFNLGVLFLKKSAKSFICLPQGMTQLR